MEPAHTDSPTLSPRFDEALLYASKLHRTQVRQGTDIPYVSHLLGVAALLMEEGGDEDEAIAALLHDAVEDQGGWPTLEEIRRRFGDRVARIVEACSDCGAGPEMTWRERKERFIARIRREPADVRRVAIADKLYNARSILVDYRRVGEAVWNRFSGGKDGTIWYYRELVKAFRATGSDFMVNELDRVVTEIEYFVAPEQPA